VYVSIHLNAAGNGKWMTARGWSGFVYSKASENSKLLARYLCEEALKRNLKGNRSVPVSKYWTADFYVLRYTKCPAVLTENLFQDNRDDVKFLQTELGKKAIVDTHVAAISRYVQEKSIKK
jgi:N-acetylmuramoyl-L-alanine amidase